MSGLTTLLVIALLVLFASADDCGCDYMDARCWSTCHPSVLSDVKSASKETREECFESCDRVESSLGQGACYRGCRDRFPVALSDSLVSRIDSIRKKILVEKLSEILLSDSYSCPASCKTKCDPNNFPPEMQAASFPQACYKSCCEDAKDH